MLFGIITACRNMCYNNGWITSIEVPVAIVSIGNLKVGGTGKTPFTQYLLTKFSGKYKTAVLSRGYGRTTHGFVLASDSSSASDIGDEPLQLYTHANNAYRVAVCEDRVAGVAHLLKQFPDLQLVLLDDGFQHRRIRRDVDILLSEYVDPFYTDTVLPSGRLREFRGGAKRADMVVFTKTPIIYKPILAQKFKTYTKPSIIPHYTGIVYGMCTNGKQSIQLGQSKVILVTGIANTKPLLEYLIRQEIELIKHFSFNDHYTFTSEDIRSVEQFKNNNTDIRVITTEKDWVKMVPLLQQLNITASWYYLPIELNVYSDETALLQTIETKIIQRLDRLS
jgi:tetraacyldisaccharide 4'-kinase